MTVCNYDRDLLFGDIVDGTMVLSEFGQIVEDEWMKTGELRQSVELDAVVVMPNHFHGILAITDKNPAVANRATRRVAPTRHATDAIPSRAKGPAANSIGAIVGQIKSASARRINALRNTPGMIVWQRGFYDRIIRNDTELDRIRTYIHSNPAIWPSDQDNPINLRRGDALRRPAQNPPISKETSNL